MQLSDEDFTSLLALRTGLRRFLHWSEQQARNAGLTPAQHQLLLAVRGHSDPVGPTIGDVADYLVLRHHSASELVDRAVRAGLVTRSPDADNASIVRVTLTPDGLERLTGLSAAHLEELTHLAPTMRALWRAIDRSDNAGALKGAGSS